MAAPRGWRVPGEIKRELRRTPEGTLEFHCTGKCAAGILEWTIRSDEAYDGLAIEQPVKDIERDFPALATLFLPDPDTLDLSEIDAAVGSLQQDGIVTAYVGSLYFSFVAAHLQDGPPGAILAMMERPDYFESFHAQYVDRMGALADKIAAGSPAQILLVDNGYSTAGVVSPAMYEKWDLPVVRAVADAAHRHGRRLHLHQHGKCLGLMDMIVSAGPDLVDPFERPPFGDVDDLGDVERRYGSKIALRGNMNVRETLLRGAPEDVEREARECIEAAAADGGFILGSGDGLIAGTPEENIFRMVKAGAKYGQYAAG